MRKFLIIFLGLFTLVDGTTQNLFLKTYDFPINVRASTIKFYDQRLFVLSHRICETTECSFLTELNVIGDTLWTTLITDVDGAPNTMVIVNDTITVTGNNDPFNTAFRMAHFSLNGEKIGQTIEIEHPTEKFTRMFQLTTQYFSGKYVICGAGWQGDTAWSLMYVVSNSGNLDTLIKMNPTNNESDLWDSDIDIQGRLTTYHWIEYAFSTVNYRKIYKFDNNFDTVWTYRTEDIDHSLTVPHGCELQDGRTLISIGIHGAWPIHSVRAINIDSSVSWQHNYTFSGSRERYILRLKTLSNGDILGSGVYSELAQDPSINGSPWLFRMSPDGELLWERTYFDIDTNDNESRRGALFDFVEIEGSDIIAVGYFNYEDNDMLIMRVDSNGCLDPGNCPVVNIITATNDVQAIQHGLSIYPNPVSDILQIDFESNAYQLQIEVLDMTGRAVATGVLTQGRGEVHTSKLSGGVYWLNIKKNGRIIATSKFVRME